MEFAVAFAALGVLVASLLGQPSESAGNEARWDRGYSETMQLRQLNVSELRTRLNGVFLTTRHPDLQNGDNTERFGGDGSYIRYLDRVREEGAFQIRGDMFCVHTQSRAQEICRHLLISPAGRLFTRNLADDSQALSVVEIVAPGQ